MKKQYIDTGEIVGTHGLRGEMRVQPWSDAPAFLTRFSTFYLDDKGRTSLKVRSARVHKNIVLLTAEGVGSIEAAERLRGKVLYFDRDEVELGRRGGTLCRILSAARCSTPIPARATAS